MTLGRSEIRRVCHPGFVDDDQVPCAEPPSLVVSSDGAGGNAVLGGQPASDVARGHPFGGEDVCGDLTRCQPYHAPVSLLPECWVLPSLGQHAHNERLTG